MWQGIRIKKSLLGACGLLLLPLAGCSPWPPSAWAPAPKESATAPNQPVMESVRHWKALAENIAQQAKRAETSAETGEKGQKSRLFVRSEGPKGPCAPSGCPSKFQKAFQELITTALVQEGMRITDNPSSRYTLKYNVHFVDHNWKSPTTLTSLTNLKSPNEVIITASLQKGRQILMRTSRLFYVRNTEKSQFRNEGSKSSGSNTLPTKTYQVVSQ